MYFLKFISNWKIKYLKLVMMFAVVGWFSVNYVSNEIFWVGKIMCGHIGLVSGKENFLVQ